MRLFLIRGLISGRGFPWFTFLGDCLSFLCRGGIPKAVRFEFVCFGFTVQVWRLGGVFVVGAMFGVMLNLYTLTLVCVYCSDVVKPVGFRGTGGRESRTIVTHLVSVHGTRVRFHGLGGNRCATDFSALVSFMGGGGLPFLCGINRLASGRLSSNVARGGTVTVVGGTGGANGCDRIRGVKLAGFGHSAV